jgi:hypothetical protein
MSFSPFSRRRLLSSLAAAGGASRLAPFLPASVYAAEAPKRILTVFHPMGYLEDSFWPKGAGSAFTLGETMTALEPWKSKLIFPDGMYVYGSGWLGGEDDNEHANGSNCVFTGSRKQGYSTGPSIEQVVADAQYAAVKTKFRALTLGVNSGGGSSHTTVFHSKAQTPVIAQNSPQAAFDSLFKDFTGPTAPVTTPSKPVDNSAAERLRAQKLSVLNLVRNDLNRLKGVVGKDDKNKVDAHLDGISSLENRLPKLVSVAPQGPAAPAGSAGVGCAKPTLRAGGDATASVQTQMDLISAAFACDLTRSASLQIGICDGFADIPGLAGQHDTTHSSGSGASQSTIDAHKKWDRYYADQWAYLLGRLDAVKEGNGTLLDNTLIVFGSDTTTGRTLPDPGAHSFYRFPLWMAGGGNFAFKTGQYLKQPLGPNPQGLDAIKKWVPHQRLLTSVVRAFGINVDKFGATDPGTGPLPGLLTV